MIKIEQGERGLTATLTFGRQALLYDIRNMAYVEGHILPDEAEHGRHMTIDIGEEGNIDRVDRLICLFMSKATELLSPYSKAALEDGVKLSDLPESPTLHTITLAVPDTMSETTLSLLERLIHEWVVCRVLGDWLSITAPEASAKWLGKAAEIEEDIKKAKLRAGRVLRRPTCPI